MCVGRLLQRANNCELHGFDLYENVGRIKYPVSLSRIFDTLCTSNKIFSCSLRHTVSIPERAIFSCAMTAKDSVRLNTERHESDNWRFGCDLSLFDAILKTFGVNVSGLRNMRFKPPIAYKILDCGHHNVHLVIPE